MDSIVILHDEKLRCLADNIYNKEAEAIKNIQFKSSYEQSQYLRQCKENHDSVLGLLASGDAIRKKFGEASGGDTLADIVQNISCFIVYCCNHALQLVPNYMVRTSFLEKVRDSVDKLLEMLNKLEPDNAADIKRFAKVVEQHERSMFQYTSIAHKSAADHFINWIKDSRIAYKELLQRYCARLGYTGLFSELKPEQRLQVYNMIIQASGIAIVSLNVDCVMSSIGVLLFTAGMMAWDIYSSGQKIDRAQRDAVVCTSMFVGGTLGVWGGRLLMASTAEASTALVMTVAVVSGILGAFVLGTFVGWFIDSIINSGEVPDSAEQHQFYFAPMPDGVQLARVIAHQ